MNRTCLACLFLGLTAVMLLAQSNPVLPVHSTASVASPTSSTQLASTRFGAAAASQTGPAQTSGLNFAPVVVYGSGGYAPYSVALADVNGDGKLDLLVANYGSGTVGVLLGNGDGTFQTAVAYGSGGSYAVSVAVADVNGDGKPDLLVANYVDDTIGVLLGNGDGTFQTVVTYGSGGYVPRLVAVADVNGDGKLDLLAANLSANGGTSNGSVGVLLGNGDGTFQTAVAYGSGGYNAYSVAVADVNGDGKPDLLVSNYCENFNNCPNGSVGVLLGNGDGTFRAAVTYESGGTGADSVAVADVNGDGKPDLLVANGCGNNINSCANGSLGVLLGNGDGTFQTAVAYFSGGGSAYSAAVADVNGDGKPDLLACNLGNDTVGVLLGNGDGTFQTAVTYSSGGYVAYSVAAADVNGDGKPDLLVANVCTADVNGGCAGYGVVGVLINTSLTPTATSVTSSQNPSNFGQPVTFSATVTARQGFYRGTPTGTVTFTYVDTVLCNSGAISGGTATCTYSNLPAGTDTVTASYSGDANFATSSGIVNQTVNKPTTTTTVTSSLNPSSLNQRVTFTATVTGQFGGTPTGTVTFTYGSTTLCNAVALSGGTASCAYSALPVGSDVVTAAYSGDANFAASSGAVSQTVHQASTTLTLISSLNPSGLDSPVTFTATITPQYGGQASGTVSFKDGSTTLGSSAVSGNLSSLTTSGLAFGTHSITAIYSGDSNFTGSTSNTLTQVVTKATTTTTLLSSINPSVQGKPVTFTASVSSLAGTPTGKVQFLNGKTVLATKALTSGSAKYVALTLPPGSNSITAVYEGDSENNGSTSAPVNQFVLAATTTTLTASPNPSKYGQAVTFTVRVTSSIGVPPNGEIVTFKKGTTVLGTGTLSGGTASFMTSTLKVGTNAIKAVYAGDSKFAGSTSNVVEQVVEAAGDSATATP
jgi:hypothetical protein